MNGRACAGKSPYRQVHPGAVPAIARHQHHRKIGFQDVVHVFQQAVEQRGQVGLLPQALHLAQHRELPPAQVHPLQPQRRFVQQRSDEGARALIQPAGLRQHQVHHPELALAAPHRQADQPGAVLERPVQHRAVRRALQRLARFAGAAALAHFGAGQVFQPGLVHRVRQLAEAERGLRLAVLVQRDKRRALRPGQLDHQPQHRLDHLVLVAGLDKFLADMEQRFQPVIGFVHLALRLLQPLLDALALLDQRVEAVEASGKPAPAPASAAAQTAACPVIGREAIQAGRTISKQQGSPRASARRSSRAASVIE